MITAVSLVLYEIHGVAEVVGGFHDVEGQVGDVARLTFLEGGEGCLGNVVDTFQAWMLLGLGKWGDVVECHAGRFNRNEEVCLRDVREWGGARDFNVLQQHVESDGTAVLLDIRIS